jgi:hypothetical protein
VLTQHASKVLSYVPQQYRVVVEPKTLSAEQLLRTDASVPADESIPPARISRRHFFEREELYKLVWTAPVSEAAKKLSVSDVGLAKLCRRAAMPLPGRGYWARVEFWPADRCRAAAACTGRSASTSQDSWTSNIEQ